MPVPTQNGFDKEKEQPATDPTKNTTEENEGIEEEDDQSLSNPPIPPRSGRAFRDDFEED